MKSERAIIETENRRNGEPANLHRAASPSPRFTVSPFHRFTVPVLVLLIATTASGIANSNPYTGIVDRNVFSLKPPTPVDNTPVEQPKPPVKLTLTGITTILGNKRALLKAQVPAKPPEPAKDESYMLTEGQRDGGVEVVSIDERAGKVTVNNNGITETLDFVNNGAKLAAAPPTAPGVIPQQHAMGIPGPGGPNNPANGIAPRTIPTRSLRTASPNETQLTDTAGRSGNFQGNAFSSQVQNITPEEQTLMIEGQKMYLQQQGRQEEANMFPITELAPGSGNDEDPSSL